MNIIAKISKGSKMDQIYLPKNRSGFFTGQYVVIQPIEVTKEISKPFFYGTKSLETIKVRIIEEIFALIEKKTMPENIIITGSFLESGYRFNDIDIIIVGKELVGLQKEIEQIIGVKAHIIFIDNPSLIEGLNTDPLYQLMLSRCVSLKRIIYKIEPKINYPLLDLHLLKSKALIDNFEMFDGNEKYYLIRNMVAIMLFIKHKKISQEQVNKEIKKLFNLEVIQIKNNLLNKDFLNKYKDIYNKTFNLIMKQNE